MRWVNYRSPTDGAEHAALLVDDELYALDRPLIALLHSDLALELWAERAASAPWERRAVGAADILAPIPTPPSVRDFMAFENHLVTSYAALGAHVSPVWYEQPAFYFSNPAAVLGPNDPVPMAPGTVRYDYEVEVAAIIGAAASDLHPGEAERHIAGYTVFCDWSARDLQEVEMAVGLGPAKGKDTATSLGPWLVTLDELEPYRRAHGYALQMTASVNGRKYSLGSWDDLYWSFGEMVAYASRGTCLRPGDVIGSGTVGTGCILELSRVHGESEYPWLSAGDEVAVEIEMLGAINSRIVESTAAPVLLR